MHVWRLICPNCGTENAIKAAAVVVVCGEVTCTCSCVSCRKTFEGRQEYRRWLEMESDDEAGRAESTPGVDR